MKLPNYEKAAIPKRKITDYLLSATHQSGSGKAGFFVRFGFKVEQWERLSAALLLHAAVNEVSKTEESPFGTRYIIEGRLESPDERNPFVRSVWFIDLGEEVPRFVSAYPLKKW